MTRDAEIVRTWLRARAENIGRPEASTPPQRGLAAYLLDRALGGAKERRIFLKWIYGSDTLKDRTKGELMALLDWLARTDPETERYYPESAASQEAKGCLRQALLDAGQLELF